MRKILFAALMSLSAFATGAWAQGMSSGITESTDPAKAADVERRAQEMQARQEQQKSTMSTTKQKSAKHGKSTSSGMSTHEKGMGSEKMGTEKK